MPESPHPDRLVARWPADRPLVALRSGSTAHPRSRWSLFGPPVESRVCYADRGRYEWFADGRPVNDAHADPLIEIERFYRSAPVTAHRLVPGWIGFLSYDLGRLIEPAAQTAPMPRDDRHWPVIGFVRLESAYLHDNSDDSWSVIGDPDALPPLGIDDPDGAFTLGEPASTTGRGRFTADVDRIIDLIRAGDIFQANLTHRLSADFTGSGRSLFAELCNAATPWYGAYLELPDHAGVRRSVLSVSPELFLELDPGSRRVTTRPMKGTRSIELGHELEHSAKDLAELNMITDLMRNDLGRVCRFGSVRVDDARAIEHHARDAAGVLQGVSTVSGTLRDDAGLADLFGATFPPGSITGAPKIRAMQIIDELEPVARGPYCGAVGILADSGFAAFNVAIRTATLTGEPADAIGSFARGTLDYSVGAGIVADSDADIEWAETLTKAGVLGQLNPEPAR